MYFKISGTPIYPESVPDEYLLRLIENADEGEKQQECVPCTINAGNLHHVSTLESNQGLANEPPINLSQAMGCATNNDHNGEETGNNELLTGTSCYIFGNEILLNLYNFIMESFNFDKVFNLNLQIIRCLQIATKTSMTYWTN